MVHFSFFTIAEVVEDILGNWCLSSAEKGRETHRFCFPGYEKWIKFLFAQVKLINSEHLYLRNCFWQELWKVLMEKD